MNKKSPQTLPLIPMKPSNVWHGHSTRPSLPAGTARKVSGSLPRGKRNRLITPPVKKNRAFPTGNALLYISLSYVDFGRVCPQDAPCFCMLKLLVLVFSKSHSHFIPKFILRNCSSIFQSCLSPHIAFQSFLVYVLPNHLF